jgi:hypothetical protein
LSARPNSPGLPTVTRASATSTMGCDHATQGRRSTGEGDAPSRPVAPHEA